MVSEKIKIFSNANFFQRRKFWTTNSQNCKILGIYNAKKHIKTLPKSGNQSTQKRFFYIQKW